MRTKKLLQAATVTALLAFPALGRAGLVVKPMLQNVRPDSVSIVFETTNSVAATLKVGLDPSLAGAASHAVAAGKIRKVRVTNLAPDTRYYYQVTSDGETSAVGTFIASPPDGSRLPFRFGVYGDSRLATWYEDILAAAGDNDDHLPVVQSMAAYAPEFVLHSGDFAQNGNDLSAVRNFFSVEKGFLINTPMLSTYGNHEFQGKSGNGTADTYLDSYLVPPPEAPNFSYYSHDYGNVHFLIVSTGRYTEDRDSYDLLQPGTPQYGFIQADLNAARANPNVDHIIVSLHVPLYSAANFGDNPRLAGILEPLFVSAGVKVVFTGHEHDYQRLTRNGITYVVTGGAGGPILDVTCGCQAATAATLLRFDDVLNYVIVDVNGRSLRIEARGVQGNGNSSSWTIDSFTL